MGFSLFEKKQARNLDLSYKTDLDFWDVCFKRKNLYRILTRMMD